MFCVNCLLRFYFVYCNNCVLNDVNGACSCSCSLVALRVFDLCFWPAKTRKNLHIFRCIHVFGLVLKNFAEINEGNRLQLLFYFIVLMGIVALVIWLSFFYLGFGCFRLKFSIIALLRKRLQVESETDLTTTGLFLGHFFEYASFRWLQIWIDWNLRALFNCFSFFNDIKFFR